jgi:dethiobiotin synthetase
VGKTEVACALLSLLAEAGLNPAPFKPYESGCSDLRSPVDASALREAARSQDELSDICPHRFRAPLAPGAAAERLGQKPSWQRTLRAFHHFDGRALVAEGAGGLLVPIDGRRDILDLISALRLPTLLVARSGLGTLNQTGLSLRTLKEHGAKVIAVVLTRTTPAGDASERDNPYWIRRRHRVRVLGPIPYQADPALRRAAFRRALRPLLQR